VVLVSMFVVGVAGMKLQLNTRGIADKSYGDAEAHPTRPTSANHIVCHMYTLLFVTP